MNILGTLLVHLSWNCPCLCSYWRVHIYIFLVLDIIIYSRCLSYAIYPSYLYWSFVRIYTFIVVIWLKKNNCRQRSPAVFSVVVNDSRLPRLRWPRVDIGYYPIPTRGSGPRPRTPPAKSVSACGSRLRSPYPRKKYTVQ